MNREVSTYLDEVSDCEYIIRIVGYMPEIKINDEVYFPQGDIILKRGNHHFGLQHIWYRHQKDIKNRFKAKKTIIVQDIVCMIMGICIKNVSIYEEENRKLAIIHTRKGKVVVKKEIVNEIVHYSIVTSFYFATNNKQDPTERYGNPIAKIKEMVSSLTE